MFNLASTADMIDSLSFLHKPILTPEEPKCKKCNTFLQQQFNYSEYEDDINIIWICPKCHASIQETTEF